MARPALGLRPGNPGVSATISDNICVQSHEFRRDLYRGTAGDYEAYRLPYPAALIAELAACAGADGAGALLDLACGTGQLSFALHGHFAETWAVDQEPDMIQLAREKATAAGIRNMRFVTSAAEELVLPTEIFDLVTIGNAFHRLPRLQVARRVWRWLRPGRPLALVWSASPWDGPEPWQQAMSATMARWRARLVDSDRIPAGYDQARRDLPDQEVLRQAGFELADTSQITVRNDWTSAELAGFTFSTSVLSRAALGPLASAFEDDLRGAVEASAAGSTLRQEVSFAVELARRPG